MKPTTLKSLFAAVPLLIATSSYGADINFSGFATIAAGATTSSSDTFDGYTSDLDFNQDSLFALQISSNLGNGLSVTSQLIARGDDDWSPAFEWAYLGYEVNDNWRILAGRQRAPFFMYSDFLDVSYAYHWISPPVGAYNLAFDSFDGIAAIYSSQLGEFDSTLHMIVGRNQDEITLSEAVGGGTTKPDFKNLVGAAWTMNRDWLTLRGAFFQADMTVPVARVQQLAAGWTSLGFADIGKNLTAEGDKVWFAELGFQVDYDDFIVIGEFTRLDLTDSGFSNDDSYYLSVGKRFDSVMVHLTYGVDSDEFENLLESVPASVATAAPALYLPTAANIANENKEQRYLTAGVKWDFNEVASMKFEVTQFDDKRVNKNDATLLKVALVTVF